MINERPAEAEDRAVPGHWEGDLLIGLERSAIGTLVERTTRFTMLIHLPREDGYRHKHTRKNGPALAGYGAVTMKNALASKMTGLPEHLRRSLTWDRGKELSAHAAFKVETDIPVYFADPQSPWQRGTNENTNGLLRQYFPTGTDLSRWDAEEIEAVAAALNARPRRILDWKTPAEALDEHLRSLQPAGVASIDCAWFVLGIGLAIALPVLGLVAALTRSEARTELAVLDAVGTSPRQNRRFAAASVGLLAVFAAALALPAGLIPSVLYMQAGSRRVPGGSLISVPTAAITIAAVGVPVVLATLAWLTAGRPRPVAALRR